MWETVGDKEVDSGDGKTPRHSFINGIAKCLFRVSRHAAAESSPQLRTSMKKWVLFDVYTVASERRGRTQCCIEREKTDRPSGIFSQRNEHDK